MAGLWFRGWPHVYIEYDGIWPPRHGRIGIGHTHVSRNYDPRRSSWLNVGRFLSVPIVYILCQKILWYITLSDTLLLLIWLVCTPQKDLGPNMVPRAPLLARHSALSLPSTLEGLGTCGYCVNFCLEYVGAMPHWYGLLKTGVTNPSYSFAIFQFWPVGVPIPCFLGFKSSPIPNRSRRYGLPEMMGQCYLCSILVRCVDRRFLHKVFLISLGGPSDSPSLICRFSTV